MTVTETTDPADVDVVIVGAGPAGLTLANYLGISGVRTVVLESRPELIDFPRGVGLDDESLRSFQAIGVVEDVLPHTTPNHWLRFVSGRGAVFASIEPRVQPYGWPRRNAFVQPLVDRVLLAGLDRFPHVEVRWGHEATRIDQDADGVRVGVEVDGAASTLRARYLVGCDGGRSMVRKSLDVTWDGKSDPTRWLVVDVRDDPVGTPNAFVIGSWRRPHVSIALPHGLRRFEFMLREDETTEMMEDPAQVDTVLRTAIPALDGVHDIRYIRSRVYTHHARIASSFCQDRVMIAGDAAHLMPVWQGQGYNSGIRDSTNLGWKLGLVAQGVAGPGLLDTYQAERHDHAAAMISISQSAGLLVRQKTRLSAAVRDVATTLMRFVPPVRRYILEMRYKPMPRYVDGVVTETARDEGSAVGTLFLQPRVVHEGVEKRLDDVLGLRFAVVMWGQHPRNHLSEQEFKTWQRLGAIFVRVVPTARQDQLDATEIGPDEVTVADVTGALRDWFDEQEVAIAAVRPDRFVAGAARPAGFAAECEQIFRALQLT